MVVASKIMYLWDYSVRGIRLVDIEFCGKRPCEAALVKMVKPKFYEESSDL